MQPGASREAVIGRVGDEWRVAIAAPPIDGRANKACVAFLSKLLRKPKRDIELVRGAKNRSKTFEIVGVAAEYVNDCLAAASK